jgi:ferrochelatase
MPTTKGLVERLDLDPAHYSVSIQSRLGRDPWLAPATDERIAALAESGVKRLAVLCPAFVADCLETIEEIGMQGKETFLEHGGVDYVQIPCLNSAPEWVHAFAGLLRTL